MKLVFIIYKYFNHGGLQRDCMRIATACLSSGHEIKIITTDWRGDIPYGFSIAKIKVNGLTNHAKMGSFVKEAKKRLEHMAVDLSIGFNKMPGLDFYFAGDACSKFKMRNKKLLLKILPRYRGYLSLEKSVFSPKSKTKIFYLTPTQKAEYVESHQTQDERFFFLPAGLEKKFLSAVDQAGIRLKIRNKLGIHSDELAMLFVGSSFPNKGLDRAIKALAAMKNEKIKLWVFGNGKQNKYIKIAKQLKVDQRLFFMGTTNELMDYMCAADVLVHPARVEAAGMVLLEAIVAGLPTITTENCGYGFHVKAASGIVLDNPFNQKKLNGSLHDLLDEKVRENMHFKMKAYAEKTDLYNMAEQAVHFIEQEGIR